MELNMNISSDITKKFMRFFKLTTAINVVRMALIILSWVVDEFEKDRIIYSIDPDGENKRKLVFPWLEEGLGDINNTEENFKIQFKNMHCPGCGRTTKISSSLPSWVCVCGRVMSP